MNHVIDISSTQTGNNKDGDEKQNIYQSGVLKLCELSFCMFARMLCIDAMPAAVFTFQSTANMDFEDTAAHL